jgi:hypothetical protein
MRPTARWCSGNTVEGPGPGYRRSRPGAVTRGGARRRGLPDPRSGCWCDVTWLPRGDSDPARQKPLVVQPDGARRAASRSRRRARLCAKQLLQFVSEGTDADVRNPVRMRGTQHRAPGSTSRAAGVAIGAASCRCGSESERMIDASPIFSRRTKVVTGRVESPADHISSRAPRLTAQRWSSLAWRPRSSQVRTSSPYRTRRTARPAAGPASWTPA